MTAKVIFYCIVGGAINLMGTVTNVLNIMVFCRQGFRESINVSLCGLAVSDLGSLLTLQWLNICFNPLFQQADLPFDPLQIEYITGGWPHVCFVRITGLITAYITLERCLCITMPLKVKLIMTPRNTVVYVISAHLVMFACTAPAYSVNLPHWEWNPRRNRTILGLRLTSNREEVEKYAHGLNNSFGFGTFAVIIVLTIILASSLNSKTRWRDQATSAAAQTISQHAPGSQGAVPTAKLASASGTVSSASKKDRRVVKMVVSISSIFVGCFIPVTTIFIAKIIVPGFGKFGSQDNIYQAIMSIAFVFETINSSVNIFIYFKLSTKFRTTFKTMFSCNKERPE
ncbi:chemosensory receptor b [Plakobranchus ocellatus]|uniref:Chemosensory receptor b n=1 Tax=Plakobranchus ocellatus TaxID=259542 RepID=A0AAV4AMN9_9GAST|nr:chemosensory receptor b [Plakobranchus ocellatus]